MYIKLDCKRNIFCEIMLVKKALYPYRECTKTTNGELISGSRRFRSKDYYNIYKIRLACSANVTTMTRYLDQYCNGEYVTRIAFVKKLLKEPEIKLNRFNFKILHGILPCNSNLKKWKIRSVDVCDVCNQIQTIEHLLYGCFYVKPLWQRINAVFGINVSYRQILGLDEHFKFDCIATFVFSWCTKNGYCYLWRIRKEIQILC